MAKRIDPQLVKQIRVQAGGVCEHCKERAGDPLQVHHCFSRGSVGQIDWEPNLIALCGAFDNDCHGRAQRYEIQREALLAITGLREGMSVDEIRSGVWAISRADKYAEVLRDA